jgi:hypothetical protein
MLPKLGFDRENLFSHGHPPHPLQLGVGASTTHARNNENHQGLERALRCDLRENHLLQQHAKHHHVCAPLPTKCVKAACCGLDVFEICQISKFAVIIAPPQPCAAIVEVSMRTFHFSTFHIYCPPARAKAAWQWWLDFSICGISRLAGCPRATLRPRAGMSTRKSYSEVSQHRKTKCQ